MVNIEAVKRILESQGKLDFKPFHFNNAEQEYWAYKTNDNKFHICDSDLKEIEKRKLPIKSWDFVISLKKFFLFWIGNKIICF